MTFRSLLFVAGGLFGVVALQATLGAQGSVTAGVYTAEQAKRGEARYMEDCAACHGDTLAGNDPVPALSGKDFADHFANVGELFDKISTSMPAMAPGSLTGPQVADVIAYILSVNKHPAGTTELPSKMDALTPIKIEPAK